MLVGAVVRPKKLAMLRPPAIEWFAEQKDPRVERRNRSACVLLRAMFHYAIPTETAAPTRPRRGDPTVPRGGLGSTGSRSTATRQPRPKVHFEVTIVLDELGLLHLAELLSPSKAMTLAVIKRAPARTARPLLSQERHGHVDHVGTEPPTWAPKDTPPTSRIDYRRRGGHDDLG